MTNSTESNIDLFLTAFSYLDGLSVLGILILTYNVLYYISYYWCCVSRANHVIATRLLPLQIYAEDLTVIIDGLRNKTLTSRLGELQKRYESFIQSDQYCHVQIPYDRAWGNCCEIPLEYSFELCKYTNDGKKIYIEREFYKRWDRCGIAYAFARLFSCGYYRLVDTGENTRLVVKEKDIFKGIYPPYYPRHMRNMERLYLDTRKISRRSGIVKRTHIPCKTPAKSLCRCFNAYWGGWELENLELALKAELDAQHLAKDLGVDLALEFDLHNPMLRNVTT